MKRNCSRCNWIWKVCLVLCYVVYPGQGKYESLSRSGKVWEFIQVKESMRIYPGQGKYEITFCVWADTARQTIQTTWMRHRIVCEWLCVFRCELHTRCKIYVPSKVNEIWMGIWMGRRHFSALGMVRGEGNMMKGESEKKGEEKVRRKWEESEKKGEERCSNDSWAWSMLVYQRVNVSVPND